MLSIKQILLVLVLIFILGYGPRFLRRLGEVRMGFKKGLKNFKEAQSEKIIEGEVVHTEPTSQKEAKLSDSKAKF